MRSCIFLIRIFNTYLYPIFGFCVDPTYHEFHLCLFSSCKKYTICFLGVITFSMYVCMFNILVCESGTCLFVIDKIHNGPTPCPTMRHSVHISVLNGALWDMYRFIVGFVRLVYYLQFHLLTRSCIFLKKNTNRCHPGDHYCDSYPDVLAAVNSPIWSSDFQMSCRDLATWQGTRLAQEMSSVWHAVLTHWGRDSMGAISQTTHLNTFSWIKIYEFRLKFHWSLFLRVQLTIFHHWFR